VYSKTVRLFALDFCVIADDGAPLTCDRNLELITQMFIGNVVWLKVVTIKATFSQFSDIMVVDLES